MNESGRVPGEVTLGRRRIVVLKVVLPHWAPTARRKHLRATWYKQMSFDGFITQDKISILTWKF